MEPFQASLIGKSVFKPLLAELDLCSFFLTVCDKNTIFRLQRCPLNVLECSYIQNRSIMEKTDKGRIFYDSLMVSAK